MQVFRQFDTETSTLAAWGVRTILLAEPDGVATDQTAHLLASLGGIVHRDDDIFSALDTVIGHTSGFGLFVVECDSFGGLDAGRQIVSMLRKVVAEMPVILISADCGEQIFPAGLHDPVILRVPLTAVSLRVGFEHAMRDRLIVAAA
jgi:hypothetical protein